MNVCRTSSIRFEVILGGHLQRQNGNAFHTEVALDGLGDFADEPLEGNLLDVNPLLMQEGGRPLWKM